MTINAYTGPGNQRWHHRRSTWRPTHEPIDTRQYGVEVIAERDAKRYVTTHHYSASMPAARLCIGLMRTTRAACRPELVGVAVFSVPITGAVITRWTGLPAPLGVELGRFVLDDSVPGNGETHCLGRAFRILAQELPEVEAVVSFSDPMRRNGVDGQVVTPGHCGIIYQAFSGRHVGRSRARRLVLDSSGHVISERALTKLRNDESGAAYAYSQLLAAGAPRRNAGESGPAYVARAVSEGPFRRVRHPGNLCYVWPTRRARKGLTAQFPTALEYPKPWNTLV